jgi:hypothetical protein
MTRSESESPEMRKNFQESFLRGPAVPSKSFNLKTVPELEKIQLLML